MKKPRIIGPLRTADSATDAKDLSHMRDFFEMSPLNQLTGSPAKPLAVVKQQNEWERTGAPTDDREKSSNSADRLLS